MILFFLVIFAVSNISFESLKEINLEEEIVFQPKIIKNQIFLFSEKKVFRLSLDSLDISNFFEGDAFSISGNRIIYEKDGKKSPFTFEGKELKVDEAVEENISGFYPSKFKKVFSDSEYFFALTEDNFLYCFRKEDSKKKWVMKIPSEIRALNSDTKRIYLLCGSDLVLCLKRKGGDIIWWKSMKERCFPHIGLLKGNLMISHRKGIQFLNAEDGTQVGEINVSMDFSPILYGDFLIFFKTDKVLIYKAKI